MAEHFMFFNSSVGDIREYQASEFAEYFSRFLSDGVYTENETMGLRVTINGLNITIGAGYAFIRGYMYKNDSDINIQLDSADGILHRIDRIILKLDITNRTMGVELKRGTMSSSPLAPMLQDEASIKEIPLAQIRVNANSTTGIIVDERVPVSSLITIPIEDFRDEFNDFISDKEGSFNSWEQDMTLAFNSWMNDLENVLDENVAGNLLNLIDEKMNNNRIHLSTSDAISSQMNEGDIWIKYGDV